MRVIFVNRFYWPETPATGQLLTDLAESLAAHGHLVSVITSRPPNGELAPRQQHNGVTIHRVRGTRSGEAGVLGKAIDFATFFCGATWRLWREAHRRDVIVSLTDPPLIGIAAWLVARWRGAKIVHWVQDIYPEVAIELAGQRWLRIARPLRNRSWRDADACVTLGADMAAAISAAGVSAARAHIIPNWAPAGLAPTDPRETRALRAAWGLEGKFIVAYSGNLGRVHDLGPVLDVADALRDTPSIVFAFIGGGAQRDMLQATVTRRGLTNVRFLPPQPRAQLAAVLSAADVHLVTLRPGCERVVFPSKLYGIAAVERPLVFIGPTDSEIAGIITARGLGRVASRDEATRTAAFLRALATGETTTGPSEQRREFAAAHTAAAGTGRWRALLEHLEAC